MPKGRKIYKHRPLQAPPKITQIGIFGVKIYHLATLVDAAAQLINALIGRTANLCHN
jgi:hypothetical protein